MRSLQRPPETAPLRQVVAAAVTLLVLGAVGAVQAGLAGASFMFDLEQVEPALARLPPALQDPHTPRLARRVFLVVIDGLRLDRSYELPFLDELRRRGVDSEATSHYPTWSRPNYVSILTGVPPAASGVRTNHHSTPIPLDSLMDRARAAGLHVATATDGAGAQATLDTSTPPAPDMDEAATIDVDSMEAPAAQSGVHAPDADLASPFND